MEEIALVRRRVALNLDGHYKPKIYQQSPARNRGDQGLHALRYVLAVAALTGVGKARLRLTVPLIGVAETKQSKLKLSTTRDMKDIMLGFEEQLPQPYLSTGSGSPCTIHTCVVEPSLHALYHKDWTYFVISMRYHLMTGWLFV